MKLSITKIFTFESAHRISNYEGACSNIHGHSYKLHVTIQGEPSISTDMIYDFKALKKLVNAEVIERFDHALILKEGDVSISTSKEFKTTYLKTEPTAERMLLFIADKIKAQLPSEIQLKKLKLYETESSYAEWEE